MQTYSDIVPMELQEELIMIRDTVTRQSWRVGDIVLLLIKLNPEALNDEIQKAVGSYVGKSSRTVREYAMISGFYCPEHRERYEVLSFAHFRTAMQLGDRWQEALEWAVAQVDCMNRPATVDAMELRFKDDVTPENYEAEEETHQPGQLRKILDRLKKLLLREDYLSDELVEDAISVIDRMKNALAKQEEVR